MWWQKRQSPPAEANPPEPPGGNLAGVDLPSEQLLDSSNRKETFSSRVLSGVPIGWIRAGWLLVGLLWLLPTLLLVAAGSWWLWQAGWLWSWLGLTGAVSVAGWLLAQWLRQRSRETWGTIVHPDPRWTPLDQAAWEKVEALALQLQQKDLPLDQPEAVLQAFYEVLATVARHYRPDSDRPELEIPAPHVLRIVERVAADLRRTLVERVPGSHWLTLHDLYKLSRLAAWVQRFYNWFYGAYRVTQLATNPAAALVREVRDAALGQLRASTTQELKEGVISFCVRQAGRYAIQLYSGKVLLEGDTEQLPLSRQTLRHLSEASGSALVEEEPIRMLILGAVGSGKNLLLPMLIGPSALPKQSFWKKLLPTKPIARHLWRVKGLPPLLVTDWPAYSLSPPAQKQLAAFETEALQTDLVLLICGPNPAGWLNDRYWLDEIRRIYQRHLERNRPPLIVLLAADRPCPEPIASQREQPRDSHRSVFLLMADLRSQLGLTEQEPVLTACLVSEAPEQVQKRLVEAIQQLLPAADRARYARYYAQSPHQERWPRLWKQLRQTGPQAGKLAVQQAPNLLKQASKALWQWGTGWLRKQK
ncbi:MAG: hypothetical protein NZ602_14460 [Thermoguttaceae bacterium]|nr:hypothetical protein [Thermoguttaceae bacterium]MDW8037531.1 hypothetical protein [Thermoguttaceae bacterium]